MNKINKLTAHDLFFMDVERVKKLWEIRDKSKPFYLSEMERSYALLDENYNDMQEVLKRYGWL